MRSSENTRAAPSSRGSAASTATASGPSQSVRGPVLVIPEARACAVLRQLPDLLPSQVEHFVRGQARLQAGTMHAVAVMMAMAPGHIRADRPGQMRSLVGAIPDTG